MLPQVNGYLNAGIEIIEQPSHTFYLDINHNIVFGYTDGQEAMKQAIYLIIGTERYRWVIFSWDYGTELQDLFGMPVSWVIPEVKRRLQEALLQDTRITAVDSFEFEVGEGTLRVTFIVRTIFGDVEIEKVVNI